MNNGKKRATPTVALRLLLCVVILAAGVGGFVVLKKMKRPPRRTEVREHPLAVRVVRVQPRSVAVTVQGYGQVRSRTVVPLSAEVSGRITFIHDRLEAGDVVNRGDVLLRIDERDYRIEYASARDRLAILRKDRALAEHEFRRVQSLYQGKKVGTLSAVEKAESALNSVADRIRQLEKSMQLAELKLERCVIRAPFTCRVTGIDVEKDEYVTPGRKLLTLTDDTDLEVKVSLDSRDAVDLLRYRAGGTAARGWFEVVEPVQCRVTWTEDRTISGSGTLDRVIRFDPETRTVFVAVRLQPGRRGSFPLVDGMFCEVDIPGRTLERVYVLPREAVSFENTVYLVKDNRLHTRKVQVARVEKGRAIISSGLAPGDTVITTRLENPLENSLVRVIGAERDGK
ncbi:MAG TPA: efflux RND transporter periplasmic adaptor subunit [Desulfobulbus sp.]|nr:efflux RND transporter periplasmic adaptor subunit [Desulfobulbus sp.]